MKLPIKKKWFDEIAAGKKEIEWRAAHITFICEETGRKLRMEITAADIYPKGKYEEWGDGTFRDKQEWKETLQDKNVICFQIAKRK